MFRSQFDDLPRAPDDTIAWQVIENRTENFGADGHRLGTVHHGGPGRRVRVAFRMRLRSRRWLRAINTTSRLTHDVHASHPSVPQASRRRCPRQAPIGDIPVSSPLPMSLCGDEITTLPCPLQGIFHMTIQLTPHLHILPFSQRPLLVGIETNPGPARRQTLRRDDDNANTTRAVAARPSTTTSDNDTPNITHDISSIVGVLNDVRSELRTIHGRLDKQERTATRATPSNSQYHARTQSAGASSNDSTSNASNVNANVWYTFATTDGHPSNERPRVEIADPAGNPTHQVLLCCIQQTLPAILTATFTQNLANTAPNMPLPDLFKASLGDHISKLADGTPHVLSIPYLEHPTTTLVNALEVDRLDHPQSELFPFKQGAVLIKFDESCPPASRRLNYDNKVIRLFRSGTTPHMSRIISPTCFLCAPPNGHPFAYFPRGKFWLRTIVTTTDNVSQMSIKIERHFSPKHLAHAFAFMYAELVHQDQLTRFATTTNVSQEGEGRAPHVGPKNTAHLINTTHDRLQKQNDKRQQATHAALDEARQSHTQSTSATATNIVSTNMPCTEAPYFFLFYCSLVQPPTLYWGDFLRTVALAAMSRPLPFSQKPWLVGIETNPGPPKRSSEHHTNTAATPTDPNSPCPSLHDGPLKPNTISVVQLNMGGPTPAAVDLLLRQHPADMYILSETYKGIGSAPKGYHMCHSSRKAAGGGTTLLTRHWLNLRSPSSNTTATLERSSGIVTLNGVDINVYSLYMRPQADTVTFNFTIPDGPCLVAGDFNISSQRIINTSSRYEIPRTRSVLHWIDTNSLTINNDPQVFTRQRTQATNQDTSPDVTCTRSLECTNWTTDIFPFSDHRIITYDISLEDDTINSLRTVRTKRSQCYYNWKKADWTSFTNDIETTCPVGPFTHRDLDAHVKTLVDVILASAKKNIPRGSRHHERPELTPEAKQILRECEEEGVKLRTKTDPTAADIEAFYKKKHEAAEYFRTIFNERRNHHLSKLNPGEPLDWKFVTATPVRNKTQTKMSIKVVRPDAEEPLVLDDALEIANHFCKKFTKPPSGPPGKKRSLRRAYLKQPHPKYDGKSISRDELRRAIHKSNNNKAPGPDDIHNEMLKHLGKKALDYLLWIARRSLSTGYVPKSFKQATIIPLFKGSSTKELDPTDDNNYRPISLTSAIAKCVESIVDKRLDCLWRPHSLQHAYQKHKCTEDALMMMLDHLHQNVNTYVPVWKQFASRRTPSLSFVRSRSVAVFVDFSGAFDRVIHRSMTALLYKKIQSLELCRWLSNFLKGREARVRLDDQYSRYRHVTTGVPQGSVLGPKLFLMYVDDLLKELNDTPGVHAFMFADDLSIIVSASRLRDTLPIVQGALDVITRWCKDMGMKPNAKKSEAMLFCGISRDKEDDIPYDITLGEGPDNKINLKKGNSSEMCKLLGINVDTKLTLNNHVMKVCEGLNMRTRQIERIANAKHGPLPSDLRSFVKGYVESKGTYGSAIFTTTAYRTYLARLDSEHRKALRCIQSLLPSTDIDSIYLETNSIPLSLTGRIRGLILREKHARLYPQWLKKPEPQQPPKSHNSAKVRPPLRRVLANNCSTVISNSSKNFYNRDNRLVQSRYSPNVRSHGVTFRCSLPKPEGRTKQEILLSKLQIVESAVSAYKSFITAVTDGSVDGPTSTAASAMYRGSSLTECQDLRGWLTDCGDCACSFTTELVAIRDCLTKLIIPYVSNLDEWPAEHQRIITILSDSKSSLETLSLGPNYTRCDITNEIWSALIELRKVGWKINLQFVYAHCGFLPNELADTLSTSRIDQTYKHDERLKEIDIHESEGVEPCRESDAAALIKRRYKRLWKIGLKCDTHRYALMGHRPTPLLKFCPLTNLPLTRMHHVQLARFRTGQSEIFGSTYFHLRGITNPNCRMCCSQNAPSDATAAQCPHCDLVCLNENDLTLHIARHHDAAREVRKRAIRTRSELEEEALVGFPCTHCPSILGSANRLAVHTVGYHSNTEEPPRNYTALRTKNLQQMTMNCRYDGCTFSTNVPSELQKHYRVTHDDTTSPTYLCRYTNCNHRANNGDGRRSHELWCRTGDIVAHHFTRKDAFDENEEVPKRRRLSKEIDKTKTSGTTPETVSHLLTCEGCTEERKRFCIDELYAKFGWKLFISLPFYAWMSSMFDPALKQSEEIQHISILARQALQRSYTQQTTEVNDDDDGDPDEQEEGWVCTDDDGFMDYGETPNSYEISPTNDLSKLPLDTDSALRGLMEQLRTQRETALPNELDDISLHNDSVTVGTRNTIERTAKTVRMQMNTPYSLTYVVHAQGKIPERPTMRKHVRFNEHNNTVTIFEIDDDSTMQKSARRSEEKRVEKRAKQRAIKAALVALGEQNRRELEARTTATRNAIATPVAARYLEDEEEETGDNSDSVRPQHLGP